MSFDEFFLKASLMCGLYYAFKQWLQFKYVELAMIYDSDTKDQNESD